MVFVVEFLSLDLSFKSCSHSINNPGFSGIFLKRLATLLRIPVTLLSCFVVKIISWVLVSKPQKEKSLPELSLDKDHSIYYQLIPGNTNMPYLVYLYEGLGCAAMWSNFPELLRRVTDFLKGIITEAAHVFVDAKTVAGIRVADEAWDRGKLRGLVKYHGEKTEAIFKAWSETWLTD